jgi:hypothetical protein
MSFPKPFEKIAVTWSGGDPNGTVLIVGAVPSQDGKTLGGFVCAEKNSAGRFTVPDITLTDMPATQGLAPLLLQVTAASAPVPFSAPGLDQATIVHSTGVATFAVLQLGSGTSPR